MWADDTTEEEKLKYKELKEEMSKMSMKAITDHLAKHEKVSEDNVCYELSKPVLAKDWDSKEDDHWDNIKTNKAKKLL